MAWRKWLVRGLVFTVLAVIAGTAWLYQSWTCPHSVCRIVVGRLEEQFSGARVSLDRAGLRLMGGISFRDLRMVRRDDADELELLHVPFGIIYHDKEQLLNGKLTARKIELTRPRIHIIRRPDGTWNLAGVLAAVDPSEPIPTIVIRQGTIVFEDRLDSGLVPVEIKDVDCTLLNDPMPVLTFQARGQSEWTGVLTARGQWQRADSALELTLEAAAVQVGHDLAQRLGCYCSHLREHAQHLTGVSSLRLQAGYRPGSPRPWSHTLQAQLRQGSLHHPQVPLPLDDLEAKLECTDGRLVLQDVTARSGHTRVRLDGWAVEPYETADLHVNLNVQELDLNAELASRLPADLQHLHQEFSPLGRAHLDIRLDRQDGEWKRHSFIRAVDVSAAFAKFPYRIDHLRGTVEHELDPSRQLDMRRLDLVGEADGRPVHVKGEIHNLAPGAAPAFHVDIWGEGIVITDRLIAALPPRYQEMARSFHPTGVGDFVARLRRAEGAAECANQYTLQVRQGTIRYDVFPYPLENVSGVLEIFPRHWEFRDCVGTHKGCTVRCFGRSDNPEDHPRMRVVIQAENLPLDQELEGALVPRMAGLRTAWQAVVPSGRMNLVAQVDQIFDQPEDIAVAVTARGVRICPTFLPYPLTDVSGTVRYAQGRVDLENLVGRHGPTQLSVDRGEVYLKPRGGFWAKAWNLKGSPLQMDPALVQALPPALRTVAAALDLQTPIEFSTELVVDSTGLAGVPPTIYWDGGAVLRDASFRAGVPLEHVHGKAFCRGRHNGNILEGLAGNIVFNQASVFGQPVRDIHCHLDVAKEEPEVLKIPDLKAKLYSGDVGGQARIEFGPSIHYDVNLTAMQVKLEEFGRHNFGAKVEYSGLATARLFLTGQGADIQGLDGRGSVEVPNGRLYNLPLLLDLLKVLGLRPPDRTAFEEAYAQFSIRGPRVTVSRLDLYGNAISLSGQGEMNLDGTDIELDFYAVWGRIMQMLPPVFRPLPTAVSQQLLRLKMRGKVEHVEITKEPVPILVDNLEKFLKRSAQRHKDFRDVLQAGGSLK